MGRWLDDVGTWTTIEYSFLFSLVTYGFKFLRSGFALTLVVEYRPYQENFMRPSVFETLRAEQTERRQKQKELLYRCTLEALTARSLMSVLPNVTETDREWAKWVIFSYEECLKSRDIDNESRVHCLLREVVKESGQLFDLISIDVQIKIVRKAMKEYFSTH